MLAHSRDDAAWTDPSFARTFTLLELGPFAYSTTAGVATG